MLVPHGSDLNYNLESVASPKGRQRDIACCSWTTASGTVTPVMFKIMDEQGEIHTVDRVHVNFREKKLYCGIPSFEYNCDIILGGITVNVILQYFPEQCKWCLYEKSGI